MAREPSVAIALGAGGARGLAHIPVLEALDELGVRPTAIAGTSIGALIGAGYAAGISGRDIRHTVTGLLRNQSEVMRRIMAVRVGRVTDILSIGHPMLVDAEGVVEQFLPPEIPTDFERLKIPFLAVATDFWKREEVVYRSGELRPAIAASIAVPGLMRPVERDGRILIDGGTVNPLPFDLLRGAAEFIIAVDVTGGPVEDEDRMPAPFEALFSSFAVMAHAIATEKLKSGAPDIVLRPNVGAFGLLDFFRTAPILRASDAIKEEVKRKLDALLAL
jgi:NTE family protein